MSTPNTPEEDRIWAAVAAILQVKNPLMRLSPMLLAFEAMGWGVTPSVSPDKKTLTWVIRIPEDTPQ